MFKYDWIWNKVTGANFANISNRPFKTHEDVLVFSQTPKFTFNPIRTPRTKKSLKRHPDGLSGLIKKSVYAKHYGDYPLRDSVLANDGKKHPVDIITFSKMAEKRDCKNSHATKKPVGLFEYLIRTYTNEGDLVFDGFGGSGTTAIAAHRAKRNFIVIEKDIEYYEKSKQRLEIEQAQQVLF